MKEEMRNHSKTQLEAYDNEGKILISNKYFIAWCLKELVEQYKDYSIHEIVSMIESPRVGTVSKIPGLTNLAFTEERYELLKNKEKNQGKKLTGEEKAWLERYEEDLVSNPQTEGLRNESNISNEGVAVFDVVTFSAKPIKHADKTEFETNKSNVIKRVVIHLELEKDTNDVPKLFSDSIFSAERLQCSSKNRSYLNTDHTQMEEVISIWICLNFSKESIMKIGFDCQTLEGETSYEKAFENPLRIFLLGLNNQTNQEIKNKLVDLIRLLFYTPMEIKKKYEILEKEYDYVLHRKEKETIETMNTVLDSIAKRQKEIDDREAAKRLAENNKQHQAKLAESTTCS